MRSHIDEMARIWLPAVRKITPGDEIRRNRNIDSAIGQDGKIIVSALPTSLYPRVISWTDTGTVQTGTKFPSYSMPIAYVLTRLDAHCTTAPTGDSMEMHIQDETTAEIANLSIAAGENFGIVTGLQVTINPGSFLQAQVTQVGSSVAGSNLTFNATLYPLED